MRKKRVKVRTFQSCSSRAQSITNLLLKPLGFFLRFEGDEAVTLWHAGTVWDNFRGLDIAVGREELCELRFAGARRDTTYENTIRYQRTVFRRSHRKTRGRGRARGRTRPLRTTGRSRTLYNNKISSFSYSSYRTGWQFSLFLFLSLKIPQHRIGEVTLKS